MSVLARLKLNALPRAIGLTMLVSLEAIAILYLVTKFPFPHLEFIYEGF